MLPGWALLGERGNEAACAGGSAPTGMSVWYKIALA